MATTYNTYLTSPRWQLLRSSALGRDGYRCRVCSSRSRLEVHHRRYPEILGNETLEDLTTLCHECHDLFSRRGRTNRWLWLVALENVVLLYLAALWLR